jgi:hypothetical protein
VRRLGLHRLIALVPRQLLPKEPAPFGAGSFAAWASVFRDRPMVLAYASRMPNLYLLQRTDGAFDEIEADSYERTGDDWVFHLGGDEVARIAIGSIVSVTKAPRGM